MKSPAQDHFDKCVAEWDAAGMECARSYAIWKDACERRTRLAIAKNNAWGELEMERAKTSAST